MDFGTLSGVTDKRTSRYDNDGKPVEFLYYPNGGSAQKGYYYTNAQGDVVRIENAYGTVKATYTYDAWGRILTSTGAWATMNPLRYRGYCYDEETGFYYLQSRYYDPKIGRFINADAYASTGQGFLGHNMFAYCGNDPINGEDNNGCMATYLGVEDVVAAVTLTAFVAAAAVGAFSSPSYSAAPSVGLDANLVPAIQAARIGTNQFRSTQAILDDGYSAQINLDPLKQY